MPDSDQEQEYEDNQQGASARIGHVQRVIVGHLAGGARVMLRRRGV